MDNENTLENHHQRIPPHGQNHYRPVPFHRQRLKRGPSPGESCRIIRLPRENSRGPSNERGNQQQSKTSSVSSECLQEIFDTQQISFERLIQQFNLANILKNLTNSLLEYSRQEIDLRKEIKDLTFLPRKIINDWHEESAKRLGQIRDELFSKLDNIECFKNQEKFTFDKQILHKQVVYQARKTIDILNGDRQDRLEVYCSLLHAEDINKSLQKQKLEIQELRKTLLDKIDIKPFQQKMEKIFCLYKDALETIELPIFLDQDKQERIPGGESILTTRATARASVFGSISNLNISTNLRTARHNQNNP